MNPDIISLCRYGKIQPAIFDFLDIQVFLQGRKAKMKMPKDC